MASFRNPIIPGFNPDPSICRVGHDYFLATSTFEFFPGVPIYQSRDLVAWKLIGHALNRRSQLDLRAVESGGGVFAPTLRYWKGRWYMTTTVYHRRSPAVQGDARIMARGFYVWTDDIWDQSKWSDPIYFDATGIDQDLYFEDDKAYFTWAKPVPGLDPLPPKRYNLSIYTMQVDLATGRSLSPAKMIRHNDSVGNWVTEGPHIFKRGEWYYLLTADGGTHTAHQEWVCRSKDGPFGPWEEGPRGVNPVLWNGDDPHVVNTGHMDMVEAPDGRWWAVFLAIRPQDGRQSQLGRETFLAPLEWVDDWPVVNGKRKISIEGPPSAGLSRVEQDDSWNASFRPGLDLGMEGWYHLRTPLRPDYDLSHPGKLGIRGGPYNLEEDESLSMVLKKQTTFTGEWTASIDFDPAQGEVAGVGVWWSKWANATVSIRGLGQGKRELVTRWAVPDGTTFEEKTSEVTSGPVRINISAALDAYQFFHLGPSTLQPSLIHTVASGSLTHRWPLSSPFTGTHFCMFAHGYGGVGCLKPAWFSDVSWKGIREGGP